MANVSLDDAVVRGSVGLTHRINESVSAVADGWMERSWDDGEIDFGVMGGVRIKC